MRQSLFRKYFSMCCSITLAGIVVLGVVFMVFAAQYFQEDKLGALEKNAEYAAQMSEKYIVSVDGQQHHAHQCLDPDGKGAGCGYLSGEHVRGGAGVHPPLRLQPHGVRHWRGDPR